MSLNENKASKGDGIEAGKTRLDLSRDKCCEELQQAKEQLSALEKKGSTRTLEERRQLRAAKELVKKLKIRVNKKDAQVTAARKLRVLWDAKRSSVYPSLKASDAIKEMNADITPGMFSTYINGKQPINTEWLLKFSLYFNVDPVDINPYLAKKVGVSSLLDNQIAGLLSDKNCLPEFKRAILTTLELYLDRSKNDLQC